MSFKVDSNKSAPANTNSSSYIKWYKTALAVGIVMIGLSGLGIMRLLHSYKVISLPKKIIPIFKDMNDTQLWTMVIGSGILGIALIVVGCKRLKASNTALEHSQIIKASSKEYSEEGKFAAIMGTHIVAIFPNLFLANEAAVGLDNPNALTILQKTHNITHVLCCIPEAPSEKDEKKRTHYYFPNDFVYARVSVGDAAKNAQEFLHLLPEAFRFIELARSQNKKVVVHCNAGNSRSPSVVIAYLMWKYKVSFEQAHNYVNERRWVQVDNFKSVLTPENLHHLDI